MRYPFLVILMAFMPTTPADWIDPDTKSSYRSTKSYVDSKHYDLVFSDEFDISGRSFADGNDPRWTSIDKNDYTNDALQYYRDNLVVTNDGKLNITTIVKDIHFIAKNDDDESFEKMTKNYQSGMIQGWNKFCFTGGIVEISAKLPGKAHVGGLWPAMWLLGNLARATYVGSSDNMWPWSYDTCDESRHHQQHISRCNRVNHFDLHNHQGRGAPEIDILEAMPGKEKLHNTPINRPYYSASLQVSPGVEKNRPQLGQRPTHSHQWYRDGMEYGENSSLNIFFYGTELTHVDDSRTDYQTDAISANRDIGPSHFNAFHTYRLEWAAGKEGYIKWYLDGVLVFSVTASTLGFTGAVIPEEPMYLILNTAMSKTWGFPQPCPPGCKCNCFDCRLAKCACGVPADMCSNFPASFLIDYVRVYQLPSDESQTTGCSTPSHPTARYIKGHSSLFSKEGDLFPLKPVSHGGGACVTSTQCNEAVGGTCLHHICVCTEHYTGPHCKAHKGHYTHEWESDFGSDFDWTRHATSLYIPIELKILMACAAAGLVGVVFYKYRFDRARHRGGYSQIGS